MAHIKNLSNRAYISGSLKDKLSRFEMYRYSFIYAPTGYGKSKVIRTFFKNYPGYTVLWIDAESSREIFWDNFCNAVKMFDNTLAAAFKKIGFPDSDYAINEVINLLSIMNSEKFSALLVIDNFEEVSRGIPTTCVIGAHEKATAEYLQNIFMSDVFRVYTSPDMLGICIGGALKNVIALAAGIADGLGYGDNTKAALITRGNAEITRLGVAMGANPHTFAGLSGIGDLIVTCASMHSRNRRAGILIGKGYTKDEAMKEVQMVVEGVFSAKAALELSKKYNIEMPIVEQVNKVLFEDKPAAEAVKELMLRDKKIEIDNSEWK